MSVKTVFCMPVELYDRITEEAKKLGKTKSGLYREILAQAWSLDSGTGLQKTREPKTTVGQIMQALSYSEDTSLSELVECLPVCEKTLRAQLRLMEREGIVKLHRRGQGGKLWIERTDI